MSDAPLRTHLIRLLEWTDAHAGFEAAVEGIPAEVRGVQPAGLPYSPWQIVEHLRLTQRDILDFCRDPDYVEPRWPDDYWPSTAEPPSEEAWRESVAGFRADPEALQRLAAGEPDLLAPLPPRP